MSRTKCVNCGEPITFCAVVGRSGYWAHPDLVDVDCHGTRCDDDDNTDAEPA